MLSELIREYVGTQVSQAFDRIGQDGRETDSPSRKALRNKISQLEEECRRNGRSDLEFTLQGLRLGLICNDYLPTSDARLILSDLLSGNMSQPDARDEILAYGP